MLDLLSGLAQGFVDGQQDVRDNLWKKEIRKTQLKMFNMQLDQEETKQNAIKQITSVLGTPRTQTSMVPQEGAMGESYPAQQQTQTLPPQSMQQFFSTPQGAGLGLQAGMSLKDLNTVQQGEPGQEILKRIMEMLTGGQVGQQGQPQGAPQAGGFGGFVPSFEIGSDGKALVKLNPNRPKFKDEYPSADGQFMIQRNEYGQEIGRRPITPGEVKPAPLAPQTKGQEAIDQEFGKEYATFKASGGFADVSKQIQQLRDVSGRLEKENLTGKFVGSIPDASLPYFAPEAQAAQDAVEEVVQRNLRLVLGAQFTEKEGERLIARSYNIKLSGTENKKRVDRLVTQIETAARAKQEAIDYFEVNGTLKGFKGKLWTMADFLKDSDKGSAKPDSIMFQEGQTATNPQTGERRVFRGGKWETM